MFQYYPQFQAFTGVLGTYSLHIKRDYYICIYIYLMKYYSVIKRNGVLILMKYKFYHVDGSQK